MTIDVKLCVVLSKHVYDDKSWPATIPASSGFESVSIDKIDGNFESINKNFYTSNSGCQAAFYYNETTNEGVIAYRGTEPGREPVKDILADIAFLKGEMPTQFLAAFDFYLAIMKHEKYGNANITITGHSLGGGLAQLVSLAGMKEFAISHQTYTFNAPGVRNCAFALGYNPDTPCPHIVNYSVMNDWCGMINVHLGALYVLPPLPIKSP